MATGSQTDSPWLFKKIITPIEPSSIQSMGPPSSGRLSPGPTTRRRPGLKNLPKESYEMADSRKPAMEKADSQEPAMKNADSPESATKSADSKKPAKTATTKTTPT